MSQASPYVYENSPPPPQRHALSHSHFFLVTLPLAIISWGVALVSQAVVTARIGNGFVGPLWFAIVLQTIVILAVAYGLLSNTLPLYQSTLSTFSALVVVFAVLGVDRNIYHPSIPAQKALSAGWLAAAILDSIWIIYFTAPLSPPSRSFELTPLRNSKQQQPPPQQPYTIQSVPTNIDAFAYSPHANNVDNSRSTVPDGAHAGSAAMTDTRVVSTATDPQQQRAVSAVLSQDGTRAPSEPSTRGSAAAAARDRGSAIQPGAEPQRGSPVVGSRSPAGRSPVASAEETGPMFGPAAPVKEEKLYPYRAEALYHYDQGEDPHELAFRKGEILEISDKSGKWWEGRRSDGTVGIAPSNYLRLIEKPQRL